MPWVGAGLRRIGLIWSRLIPNLQLLEQITAKTSKDQLNSSQPIDKRARSKCLLYVVEFWCGLLWSIIVAIRDQYCNRQPQSLNGLHQKTFFPLRRLWINCGSARLGWDRWGLASDCRLGSCLLCVFSYFPWTSDSLGEYSSYGFFNHSTRKQANHSRMFKVLMMSLLLSLHCLKQVIWLNPSLLGQGSMLYHSGSPCIHGKEHEYILLTQEGRV